MPTTSEDHDDLVRLIEAAKHNREAQDRHNIQMREDFCKLQDRVAANEKAIAKIPEMEKDILTLQGDMKLKLNTSTLAIWVSLTAIICTTVSFAVHSLMG